MDDVTYLTGIIEPLLEEPEKLTVVRTVDDMGVLLSVQCGRNDMGRLIGREGSTAKSIRGMMRVFGMIHDARVNVKLLEPEGSTFRKKKELHDALSDFTGTAISA